MFEATNQHHPSTAKWKKGSQSMGPVCLVQPFAYLPVGHCPYKCEHSCGKGRMILSYLTKYSKRISLDSNYG